MKLRFCLKEVQVENNQQIQIIGNKEGLGIWHIPNAIEMVPGLTDSMTPESGWISKEITIESELDCKDIEYKYLISQKGGVQSHSSKWEKGKNRVLNLAEFFHKVTNQDNSYVLI